MAKPDAQTELVQSFAAQHILWYICASDLFPSSFLMGTYLDAMKRLLVVCIKDTCVAPGTAAAVKAAIRGWDASAS